MRTAQGPDGALLILADDGRPLARVAPAPGAEPVFADTAASLASALGAASTALSEAAAGRPRVVVTHREGLVETAVADLACELHLLEEDRYGDPPLLVRLRDLPADPDGVATALDGAGARGAVRLRWAP